MLKFIQNPGTDTSAVKEVSTGVAIGLITKGRFYANNLAYTKEELRAILDYMEQ